MRPHALALLPLTLFAARLHAQTTVVVPCDLDNTLYEDPLGALSNGQGTSVFVGLPNGGGKRRAVLHFDVAGSIPAGARVLSASLSVNVGNSAAAANLDVTGHFVLQPWGEGASGTSGGGGGGAPAMPGDATWIHSFYPNTFWAVPGGYFVATPSFTMSTPQVGLATSPATLGLAHDVQTWIDTPTQNFGWLLKMVDEVTAPTARRIDSRESTGIHPALSVTYVVAGAVGTWGTGCPVGSGTFGFAYVGAPVGGSSIQLTQSNGPANSIGANFFALALDPIGVALFPACTVHLPPEFIPGNVFTLDAQGAASSPLNLPVGFSSYLVVCQSAALANNSFGFVLSNAGYLSLQ